MNLLERLHPVYQDKLTAANLQYPHIVASITDALEEVEFVTELKYETIMNLNNFCGFVPSPFDYFTEQL